MKIGVLALQGTVREHVECLKCSDDVEVVTVKRPEQLAELDGLVLPGGEISTIHKLMDRYGFFEPLKQFGEAKKPIFGTAAGLIVMATSLVGEDLPLLHLMDMTVIKDMKSFETDIIVTGIGEDVPAVFVHAPRIIEVGENVEILSKYEEEIVVVKQDHYLACSFHPELTNDRRFHKYFIEMVRNR